MPDKKKVSAWKVYIFKKQTEEGKFNKEGYYFLDEEKAKFLLDTLNSSPQMNGKWKMEKVELVFGFGKFYQKKEKPIYLEEVIILSEEDLFNLCTLSAVKQIIDICFRT